MRLHSIFIAFCSIAALHGLQATEVPNFYELELADVNATTPTQMVNGTIVSIKDKTIPNQFAKAPVLFVIGIVLIFVMICMSNAGGLSGGGSIIPIMLIFFDMSMRRAVPMSATVAVISTVCRFVINFKQMHPKNPERLSLNYEIVNLTMPLVFLGSMVGVQVGHKIGSDWQTIIFALTISWSIYTSTKRVLVMIEKEKNPQANLMKSGLRQSLIFSEKDVEDGQEAVTAETPELQEIKYQEAHHFTLTRVVFSLLCFFGMFFTSLQVKQDTLSPTMKWSIFGVYSLFTMLLTLWSANESVRIHKIKERDAYKFDASDIDFSKYTNVFKLSFCCGVAAMLCGMTGIAGGMVIGPLFLSYHMIPQVMSATNQYITMVASFSVLIQFFMEGLVRVDYAICFGIVAFIASMTGIFAINKLLKKSGKQSTIAIILITVLVVALLLLPLKYVIKQ
jgi:uncharacterized membrane protein YfcA